VLTPLPTVALPPAAPFTLPRNSVVARFGERRRFRSRNPTHHHGTTNENVRAFLSDRRNPTGFQGIAEVIANAGFR